MTDVGSNMYYPGLQAAIFDLDGVICKTQKTHALAWKWMFDAFLQDLADKNGTTFRPFDEKADYLGYVDGKPRMEGIASFLKIRQIDLPWGTLDDPPEEQTICGLGHRKNVIFNELIDTEGVEIFPSTLDFIGELKSLGIKIGVASSSKNCGKIIQVLDIEDLFGTCVDGIVSQKLHLKGKPEPDIFITAAENLGCEPDRCIVVEDAVSGVQAGSAGNFGWVVGLAREDNHEALLAAGADIAVSDLEEIMPADMKAWFETGKAEDGWRIQYHGFDPEKEAHREALLAVGNGIFCTRGAMEESEADGTHYPATYMAGVYNRLTSTVGDRQIVNEDLVNCPNWLPITFKIGTGDYFSPTADHIVSLKRSLNLKTGVLYREMIVVDERGRKTKIESQRFASMALQDLAGLRYQLTPLNYADTVTIRTGLDAKIKNDGVARYRSLNQQHIRPESKRLGRSGNTSKDAKHINTLTARTVESDIEITLSERLEIFQNDQPTIPKSDAQYVDGRIHTFFSTELSKNMTLRVDKLVALSAHSNGNPSMPPPQRTFDETLAISCRFWQSVWDEIDITLEGDRLTQKAIRLNMYHLICSASPLTTGKDVGIPARGLHGEAYRGHIFWDDMFILPFYFIHFPKLGRSLINYRKNRLKPARKMAKQEGYDGALFPWQSGLTGIEETQSMHLNPLSGKWGMDHSYLQRHVSLAIAYNVWHCQAVTGDVDFFTEGDSELFFDICRFWASAAQLDPVTGRYDIPDVMGPDEFHEKYPDSESAGLTNNAYTNLMTAWLLKSGIRMAAEVTGKCPDTKTLGKWEQISRSLRININQDGVIEQFQGYFDLAEIDWDGYRDKHDNIGRMDRILRAEGLSPDTFKVSKQADLLMAFFCLGEAGVKTILNQLGYRYPENLLNANFDYYYKRTSHGSTLSHLVHGRLASDLGCLNLAVTLFDKTLTSDFIDIQGGTTGEGIHTGAMAGSVLMLLTAFAGLDWKNGNLKMDPALPAHWRQLRFGMKFNGRRYLFDLTKKHLRIRADGTTPVVIFICGRKVELAPGKWTEVDITTLRGKC